MKDKFLVVYHSYDGATKKVANLIAGTRNFDVVEVKPKQKSERKGFSKYFWGGKQVFLKELPELIDIDVDFSNYETFILCSPIWAGTFTPPIRTLLEKEMIKDKRVVYVCTHDGGASKAFKKAEAAISKNNTFVLAKDYVKVAKNFNQLKDEIIEFANSL